eukprot:TRINITY_DN824_c0_g1_i1.p1 TRINITY_DN824_c0_g1~~TRINITY_DN824_c0_g1_i1.p1  ORF type:complete len:356 (+),score=70.15 TRINITY_DN824_c0_g1_i1:232-1299(+)
MSKSYHKTPNPTSQTKVSLIKTLATKISYKKTILIITTLMTTFISIELNQRYSIQQLRQQYDQIDLTGKQVLVVGGTAGIGMGIAKFMSSLNADVIIVGRNQERGEGVVQEMDLLGNGVHAFVQSDAQLISSAVSLREVLEDKEGFNQLDYLVCSQGIATFQGRTETEEGIDQKMALHYYSRVAIVNTLSPFLEMSEDPRVMFVLSGGVHSAYKEYETDPHLHDYSLTKAANAAGMYSDIAVDSLSREYPSVAFYHSSPGFVASSWGTDLPRLLLPAVRVLQALFGKTTEDSAIYLSRPMLLHDRPENGWAIIDQYGALASVLPEHDASRESIWNHTLEVMEANHIAFPSRHNMD